MDGTRSWNGNITEIEIEIHLMKNAYVRDLEANQQIHTTFLVGSKDIRQKKSGEPFLSLILLDKSGDIDAKMWDNVAEVMDTFERDDFLKIKGVTQVFQNKIQLTIHKLQKIDDREADFADFFPSSRHDANEMMAELEAIIASFENPHLKGLLVAFFADPDIRERYRIAPAAKTIHHGWRSGLLEHVLSMCRLAIFTASHYPIVDRELLLTGVILHDIGKIHELTYQRGFGYSDEGQLLGHIIIAMRMLDEKIRLVDGFPVNLRTLVEHMVVSHHGQLDYGSPKVPMFAEAMLLHHLDNLDSKMETVRGALERDKQLEGNWTGWINSLERVLLKKDRFLNPPAATSATAPVTTPVTTQPSPTTESKPVTKAQQGSMFGDKLLGALAQPKS